MREDVLEQEEEYLQKLRQADLDSYDTGVYVILLGYSPHQGQRYIFIGKVPHRRKAICTTFNDTLETLVYDRVGETDLIGSNPCAVCELVEIHSECEDPLGLLKEVSEKWKDFWRAKAVVGLQ